MTSTFYPDLSTLQRTHKQGITRTCRSSNAASQFRVTLIDSTRIGMKSIKTQRSIRRIKESKKRLTKTNKKSRNRISNEENWMIQGQAKIFLSKANIRKLLNPKLIYNEFCWYPFFLHVIVFFESWWCLWTLRYSCWGRILEFWRLFKRFRIVYRICWNFCIRNYVKYL